MMKKTILLDGAMGTQLMNSGYTPPFEELNISHPELINRIHSDYISAGSEVILTNTFKAQTFHECEAAWKIVKDLTVKKFASIGPEANCDLVVQFFKDKADRLVFETIYNLDVAQDLINKYSNLDPIFSFCLKPSDFKIALTMLEEKKLSIIGLNCLDGLKDAQTLLSMVPSHYEIYFKPNTGVDKKDAKEFSKELKELLNKFPVSYLGGCCGSTPEHIKAIQKVL